MMIKEFKDTPFELNNQEVLVDEEFYKVYPDIWPACDGHLLFVPKLNTAEYITKTLGEAIAHGNSLIESGEIDGYHFGMNMGEPAGQTVMWPHVHFLPRKTGDIEGFPGSVRLAHRGHRGAEYYGNHPEYMAKYRRAHPLLWNDEDNT
jgi:diadenosine tetraphosphate (Ap4A) HIT family hydrolase